MMQWDPQAVNPRRCLECGSHVTPEFRRGYGDEDDVAHRCPDCDTYQRLSEGSAAGQEVDSIDPLEEPVRFGKQFNDLPARVRTMCRNIATDGGEST